MIRFLSGPKFPDYVSWDVYLGQRYEGHLTWLRSSKNDADTPAGFYCMLRSHCLFEGVKSKKEAVSLVLKKFGQSAHRFLDGEEKVTFLWECEQATKATLEGEE